MEKQLYNHLVKLAHDRREIRKHLTPLLRKYAAFSVPFASSYSGKIALILAAICNGSITTSADFVSAIKALRLAAMGLQEQLENDFGDSPRDREEIAGVVQQFKEDLKKKLKPVL